MLWLVSMLLPACSVFLPARSGTFVTDDQKVTLTVQRGTEERSIASATSGFFGADALIGFVKAQALAAIDADQSRYKADYGASVLVPQPAGMAPGVECHLRLQRAVKCDHELASEFEFEIKKAPIGAQFLLVQPTLVHIKLARAKVLGWNPISVPAWFMPKSDTLNIVVTVKVDTFSVDNNKGVTSSSSASFVFNDYPLDDPTPELKDFSNAPGVLAVPTGSSGQMYLFTVSVTEADPLHAEVKADPVKDLLSKLIAELQAK
ncbi:MAG TPA: hypothetical protein VFF36_19260 [Planctomycetota bacterium]|nr:hypothetical protein [Planctomycetota bacterium]